MQHLKTFWRVYALLAYHLILLALAITYAPTLSSMHSSATSLFGKAEATNTPAAYSERVTPREQAIRDILATPEMKAYCENYANFVYNQREGARLNKELDLNKILKENSFKEIETSAKNITNAQLQPFISVKDEAKAMIYEKTK